MNLDIRPLITVFVYTLCLKKPTFYILNISTKNEPVFNNFFGVQNPE